MNLAFWDPAARCLVAHESVPMNDQDVTVTALRLVMVWQSGQHAIPSPYWLAWGDDDPTAEYLRLFFLQGDPDLPESVMDEIRASAARLATAH